MQSEYQAAIESYPRILSTVTETWKTRELDSFLRKMILDSRDGSRQGFPMTVAEELLFLAELNRKARAMDTAAQLNIKYEDAYKLVFAGDEASVQGSPWDDPSVSKDASSRQKTNKGSVKQLSSTAKEENKKGLLHLFGELVLSKWVVLSIVVMFCVWSMIPQIKKVIDVLF